MTLRVDFYRLPDVLLGSARLHGTDVQFDDAVANYSVDIGEPGTFVRLTPADGDRYLKALPHHYRSAYLWCEVVDEDVTEAVKRAFLDVRHYAGKHDQKSHGNWAKGQGNEASAGPDLSGSIAAQPNDWVSDGSAAARKVQALRDLGDELQRDILDRTQALTALGIGKHIEKMNKIYDDDPETWSRMRDELDVLRQKRDVLEAEIKSLETRMVAQAAAIIDLPPERRGEFSTAYTYNTNGKPYAAGKVPEPIKAGAEFLSRIVDLNHVFGNDRITPQVFIHSGKGFRAYALADKAEAHLPTVKAAGGSEWYVTATYVHEVGHILEAHGKNDLLGASIKWRDARTKGETFVSIKQYYLDRGRKTFIRDDEVALIDTFSDPYVGKIYTSQTTGSQFSTEVISVGLEKLYYNPTKFAREDPGHAQFVLWAMQGDD